MGEGGRKETLGAEGRKDGWERERSIGWRKSRGGRVVGGEGKCCKIRGERG